MASRRASPKRVPFPASTPHAAKRAAGVTSAAATPLAIRLSGVAATTEDRAHVRTRLGTKLSKFATSIERSTVRFRDDNGPRGGVDVVCTIKVVLRGLESVVYEATGPTVREAFDGAASGAVRAVKRSLGRADRTTPRPSGRAASAGGAAKPKAKAKPVAATGASASDRGTPRASGKSATQIARREVRALRSPKTRARSAAVRRRGKVGAAD